jgi:hypothetical protein
VTVLEAQQKAIDKNPRMPFYNLNIDAGALWARRMIDRMLASEHGQRERRAQPPSKGPWLRQSSALRPAARDTRPFTGQPAVRDRARGRVHRADTWQPF